MENSDTIRSESNVLVSVIIPTYNRAHLLHNSIKSVQRQSISKWELLIIDDGSSDNTKTVVESINDSRIKYFYVDRSGRSKARNFGIQNADGLYLVFLDSDDELQYDALDIQLKNAKTFHHKEIIVGKSSLINVNGSVIDDGKLQSKSDSSLYRNFTPGVLFLSNLLVKNNKTNRVFFDESLERFEDLDFYRRYISNENSYFHDACISKILTHSGNILQNQDPRVIEKELLTYFARCGGFGGDDKRGFSDIYQYYGLAFLSLKGVKRYSTRFLIKATILNPLKAFKIDNHRILLAIFLKKILLRLNFLNIPKLRRLKFWLIYRFKLFGKSESISGPGSSLGETEVTRQTITTLITQLALESIADAPCGDFLWMSRISEKISNYHGYDIVQPIVERNRKNYPNLKFSHMDLVNEVVGRFDLIICRDLLVHLTNDEALRVITNFRKSSSRYLLITTFPTVQRNVDLGQGIWRPLNLSMYPFNLGKPLDLFLEDSSESPQYADKSLGLWDLQELD
jgi:glycosyltransferase involved in cell wall biosynthesis